MPLTDNHKTGEALSPEWLEGFFKAAHDLGVTEPQEAAQLLKYAQRLHFLNTRTSEYQTGFDGVLAKEGMDKEAGFWNKAKILGLLGLGGAGMVGAQAGARNIGIRPFNRNLWTMEDLQNSANEYKDVAGRIRPYTSPFGMMGQQSMYRPSYFNSPYGGYPAPY